MCFIWSFWLRLIFGLLILILFVCGLWWFASLLFGLNWWIGVLGIIRLLFILLWCLILRGIDLLVLFYFVWLGCVVLSYLDFVDLLSLGLFLSCLLKWCCWVCCCLVYVENLICGYWGLLWVVCGLVGLFVVLVLFD